MEAKELGAFIAGIRKEKQITQAELAKRVHVTDKAVSRWERGVREIRRRALTRGSLPVLRSRRVRERK